MTRRIDVSIVAYRNRDEIARCISRAQAIPDVGTVVVVDHGDDGTGDVARAAGATVIENPLNPGFGSGHNRAVATLDAPFVLLLNPDCLVEPAAVAEGAAYLDRESTTAAVQGVVVDGCGKPERSQGLMLGPQHLVGRALGARHLVTLRPARALARQLGPFRDHVERVPADAVVVQCLAATALLVRREAFIGVGGFDSSFFLYGEDVDLCRRLQSGGWSLVALPRPWASHRSGGSFGSRWEREMEWWRGSLRLAAGSWTGPAWGVARAAAAFMGIRLTLTRPRSARRVWLGFVVEPARRRRARHGEAA